MTIRSLTLTLALTMAILTLAAALTGCGPTKAGLEARSDAKDRLNVVNAQLSYDQAKRAFEVGQFERAMREISMAIERRPATAEYHLLKGRILLETHRLEQALYAFEEALEHNARSHEAQYFAGIVFQRWSDSQRAYERYRAASELDPSNAQYLLAAAESLIALGDYDAAKQLVTPRLTYFEHNAALRHLLGQIALLQHDPRTAARLYAEARLLNPDDPILLEELAWAQYAAGMYGRCHESLRYLLATSTVASGAVRASSSAPRSGRVDLMHLEAKCLVHMGRLIEARNAYLELTRLNPSDVDVWIELGAVARDLGDVRRVAMCGGRAVALAPERYEGYMLQALAARESGDEEECERLLRKAAERASENALPHLFLGRLHEQAGNVRAALVAYAAAVEAEPGSAEAHDHFSRLTRQAPDAVVSVPNVDR